MGLCPANDISGGKVLWTGTRKVKCRAAMALRMAAQSLHHSKSALGDFYRRMRAKLGAPKAITAAAHKLSRIIFHLITTRQEFDDSRFGAAQLRYEKRQEAKFWARHKLLDSNSFQFHTRVKPVSSLRELPYLEPEDLLRPEAFERVPCVDDELRLIYQFFVFERGMIGDNHDAIGRGNGVFQIYGIKVDSFSCQLWHVGVSVGNSGTPVL
jgi:hypothetical protein